MIITDRFVVINYPKTGTTFFRKVIKDIYENNTTLAKRFLYEFRLLQSPIRELMLPKLYGDYDPSVVDQHGVYRQIPPEDVKKTIVSIARNPLTKYISSFVFGWWKQHPPFDLAAVKEAFPTFPDLSFPDFYTLVNHPLVDEDKLAIPGARSLGSYTRMFLVFYSKDPDVAVQRVLNGECLDNILPAITFLHQEFLEDELEIFLREMSYEASHIRRVRTVGKLNVGSKEEKSAIKSDELIEVAREILTHDKALLDTFSEYGQQIEAIANGADPARMPTSGFTGPRKLGR